MPYTANVLGARIITRGVKPGAERYLQGEERDTDEDESRSGSRLGIFKDEQSNKL